MSKDSPFFKFDAKSWLSGTIQFTSLEVKGLFIDLCAIYWEKLEPIKIDAKLRIRMKVDEGTLSNLIGTLVDLEIISVIEHEITIPFLDKLQNERKEFKQKCSEGGKKSKVGKGTSSNKKEERREKILESRDIKKEIDKEKIEPPAKQATKPKEERIEEFRLRVRESWEALGRNDYLPASEVHKFFSYWTESGQNDKKVRFEKEKVFEIGRRLGTWKSNYDEKNQKPKKPRLEH